MLYLSGMKDYTRIFLINNPEPVTTLENLKEFEKKLPEDDFLRVHKSYIISLEKIESIVKNEIQIGSFHIPIGSTYKKKLDSVIAKYS